MTNKDLTNDERYDANDWFEYHECIYNKDLKVLGFVFSDTPIGVVVTATCSCGKCKDVTDYSTW
jgi:hypothetical protein